MTFENQVKEAKQKKWEMRVYKDAIMIIIGILLLITFLFLEFYKPNTKKDKSTTKTTTTINK